MKAVYLLRAGLALMLCYLSVFLEPANRAQAQVDEFDLDNGIHVIVNSIAEASDIGVETFYEVGFIDEPESMVQSSHLLEHLVCYSPGAGFKPKQAMAWLNKDGMANAETMPDFTHYDYASSAENLDKILEIEAARLVQKKFDPEMIAFEAKRVYQETDFVESNPKAGMLKHAFMALAHAWKYQSKSALVRGGLENMDAAKLHEFYKSSYHPRNLTIAITGKTTADEAKQLVEKHFGNLPDNKKPVEKFDWAKVPAKQTIAWDSKHRAVCVAWNPPSSKKDQVMISLLGAMVAQKLMNENALSEKTEMVMCSNNMWMVGDLPLFIYALAKPGEDLDKVASLIKQTFEKEIKTASENSQMVKSFAIQLDFQRKPTTWARVQQSSTMVQNMGRDENSAMQMVLANDALQRCNLHRLLGHDPGKMIAEIKQVENDATSKLIANVVKDQNLHVVKIVPMDD